MTKKAVARQFFRDFIENLGDNVNSEEKFEEESTMIITEMFFAGQLELKWNPKTDTLMFKPTFVIDVKEDREVEELVKTIFGDEWHYKFVNEDPDAC